VNEILYNFNDGINTDTNIIKENFYDNQRVLAQFNSKKNGIDSIENLKVASQPRFSAITNDSILNQINQIQVQEPLEHDHLTFVSENIEENNMTNATRVVTNERDEFGETKKIKFISNAHFINKKGKQYIAFDESNLDSTIKENSLQVLNYIFTLFRKKTVKVALRMKMTKVKNLIMRK